MTPRFGGKNAHLSLLPVIQGCLDPLQCANNPQMNFTQMHERLRRVLVHRLSGKSLTVKLLKDQTGLTQGHLSNFLREKRMISYRAADLILQKQRIEVEDLLSASRLPGSSALKDELNIAVPVVSEIAAIDARVIPASAVISMLPLPHDALQSIPAHPTSNRLKWQRFVAIRIPSKDALPMEPLLLPDALVVLDRHNNSFKREDRQRLVLYAVHYSGHIVLRYVTRKADQLVLRPHSQHHQVELIQIDPDQSPDDWIIGRVVYVLNKLYL